MRRSPKYNKNLRPKANQVINMILFTLIGVISTFLFNI